jgi:1-phosphofructokinase
MKPYVLTVTLNPALDKTAIIDKLNIGGLNRVKTFRIDPGGKGINVAKVLKNFSEEVKATGLIAGNQGKLLLEYLSLAGIKSSFHEVVGETRTNLKIYEEHSGTITEINDPGFTVTENDLLCFERKLSELLGSASFLVLSGSLPIGATHNIYNQFIKLAKSKGLRTMLDADGMALQNGIKAVPYAIKPNIYELELLTGKKMSSLEHIVDAARSLTKKGIEIVAVSMGEDGAVVCNNKDSYHVSPLPIKAKSPVGAGDSMVAALVFAFLKAYPLDEAAKWAVAAGTATAAKPGTELCTLEEIPNYIRKVKINKLN